MGAEPLPGPAAGRRRDPRQRLPGGHAVPGMPGGQPGDLLGEGDLRAVGGVAEEPPRPQMDHRPPTGDSVIIDPPLVTAVHPLRTAAALGTGSPIGLPRTGPDP